MSSKIGGNGNEIGTAYTLMKLIRHSPHLGKWTYFTLKNLMPKYPDRLSDAYDELRNAKKDGLLSKKFRYRRLKMSNSLEKMIQESDQNF